MKSHILKMIPFKTEKIDTNNAWGFGGGTFTRTYYTNGLHHDIGRYYYRHTRPSELNRWMYGDINVYNSYTKGDELLVVYRTRCIDQAMFFNSCKVEIPDAIEWLSKQLSFPDKVVDFKIIEL